MELFKDFFERRNLSAKDPALKALLESWGGRETVAGAHITPASSLQISGWYAGVRILSETLASLPMITYQRTSKGRERVPEHPVYRLLHDKPNPFMTAVEFYEASNGHLLTWGNSFAAIERANGTVTALWPLAPDKIRIQVFNGRLWYYYQQNQGGELQIPAENMLHVRGLSSDGVLGYSPVDLCREALGLARVEEEYRARFFKNDARPGGIIEYPGNLSDAAYKRYKEDWETLYSGIGNKFRLAFLESGLKYHDVGFPPEAAQFIEGRKFQIEEIARILGVPLVLLQSTEKATSWGTGIEQFLLGFIKFTIRPWLARWEARLNVQLFTETEQRTLYAEALVEDLLRADSLTRAQVLQILRRNGCLSANEWRGLENMNELPGTEGDTYIIEGNMTRLDQVGKQFDDSEDEPMVPAMNGNGNGASRPNGAAK